MSWFLVVLFYFISSFSDMEKISARYLISSDPPYRSTTIDDISQNSLIPTEQNTSPSPKGISPATAPPEQQDHISEKEEKSGSYTTAASFRQVNPQTTVETVEVHEKQKSGATVEKGEADQADYLPTHTKPPVHNRGDNQLHF